MLLSTDIELRLSMNASLQIKFSAASSCSELLSANRADTSVVLVT